MLSRLGVSKKGRKGYDQLVDKLQNDKCTCFDTENFPCNESWPSEDEITTLAKFLGESTKCKEFWFRGEEDGTTNLSDDCVVEIANALQRNSSVDTVGFEYHKQVGPRGAKALAEMLKVRNMTSTPILDFRISWCPIGDEGVESISEVLPLLTTLEYLGLNDCTITDVGAELLNGATRENKVNGGVMEELDFDGNPDITPEMETKLCRTMIECGIEPNEFMSDNALAIFESLEKKDEEERKRQTEHVRENLDNPKARDEIASLEHKMFGIVSKFMLGEDARALGLLRNKVNQLVRKEVDRIARLTEERKEYYSLSALRWNMLRDIQFDNERTLPHVQPIAIPGNDPDEARNALLGGIDWPDDYRVEDNLKGTLARIHAKSLSKYFRIAIEKMCEWINVAKDIKALQISQAAIGVKLPQANLAFNDDALVDEKEKKRVSVLFGPVKKLDRALVKASEYQEEIKSGAKHDKFPDGHVHAGKQLSGMDYVLDWLRATVTAEDPYVLYVFFCILRRHPFFKVQRVKNKFFDDAEPPNIRTNVLINTYLLYPPKEYFFTKKFPAPKALEDVLGPWNPEYARKPLTCVEIQLTLKDFQTIKRLMHSYYNVERSPDPLFLLNRPLFVDADTLEAETPNCIRELQEQEKSNKSGGMYSKFRAAKSAAANQIDKVF